MRSTGNLHNLRNGHSENGQTADPSIPKKLALKERDNVAELSLRSTSIQFPRIIDSLENQNLVNFERRSPQHTSAKLGMSEFIRIYGHLANKRVMMIGAGGGGDIYGTLPDADRFRQIGAEVFLAGLTLKRATHDRLGLPIPLDAFKQIHRITDAIGEVNPNTHFTLSKPDHDWKSRQNNGHSSKYMSEIREVVDQADRKDLYAHDGRNVYHTESDVADFVRGNNRVFALDVTGGIDVVRRNLEEFMEKMEVDHIIVLDAGGDILVKGDEPTIRSPLCDQIMLGAVRDFGDKASVGVIGLGGDGELPLKGFYSRFNDLAERGGFLGANVVCPEFLPAWMESFSNAQTESSKQPLKIAMNYLDGEDYLPEIAAVQDAFTRIALRDPRSPSIEKLTGAVTEVPLRNEDNRRIGELSRLSIFSMWFKSGDIWDSGVIKDITPSDMNYYELGAKYAQHGVITELVDRG